MKHGRTFNFDGYTLRLIETGKRDNCGKVVLSYTFRSPQRKTIFSGNDFPVSPMHEPFSKASAISLLDFLTLKPGDTDEDYFKDYTPEQTAFALSNDCENLSMRVYDFETRKEK